MTLLASESFNKADSTTLGPDLAWTEVVGNAEVLGNRFHNVTVAGVVAARCNTDLGTADHYAQAIISTLTRSSFAAGELSIRFANAADTRYTFVILKTSAHPAGAWAIDKTVAGVNTGLVAETAYTWAANDVVKFQASGSTLKGYINGVEVASFTDTSIATGTKVGLGGYRDVSGDDFTWDSFEAGDLLTPPPIPELTPPAQPLVLPMPAAQRRSRW